MFQLILLVFSTIRSVDLVILCPAVDQLPLYLTSAVFAIIGGVGVRVTGRYKYIVLSGWVLIIAGTALNTMLKVRRAADAIEILLLTMHSLMA